jgi:hypothetical protein
MIEMLRAERMLTLLIFIMQMCDFKSLSTVGQAGGCSLGG